VSSLIVASKAEMDGNVVPEILPLELFEDLSKSMLFQ